MTSDNLKNEQACAAYVLYFETLKPHTIASLDDLAIEGMVFEDPFNKLQSRSDVKRVFEEMFEQMDNPAFKVLSTSWTAERESVILKWRFTGQTHKLGPVDFEGMSEIHFNEEGKVTSHIDFWDAGTYFYEKIPVLGMFIRMIKRSMRLS